MTEIVEAAGSNVALLLPSYELAPYARYPHQLIQAVEVLRHLVTELKYDPANIILGGDSAGKLCLGKPPSFQSLITLHVRTRLETPSHKS